MYNWLLNRLHPINYKTITSCKGELVESSEIFTFSGYVSYSFEHLVNAGVDVTGIKASIVTDKVGRDKLEEGYLIEIENGFYAITKIISYTNPFSSDQATFEVLI